jgi:hypothetical protein
LLFAYFRALFSIAAQSVGFFRRPAPSAVAQSSDGTSSAATRTIEPSHDRRRGAARFAAADEHR